VARQPRNPTEDIQSLTAKLADKAREIKLAEDNFRAEQQARTQQFRELQSQLTEMSNRLIEQYTEGWVEPPPVVEVPELDNSGTKAARLKRLYKQNPRMTIQEATRELEDGNDDQAAQKRTYAIRHYLSSRDELREEEDGSWTVVSV
jgi:hypothetical protein